MGRGTARGGAGGTARGDVALDASRFKVSLCSTVAICLQFEIGPIPLHCIVV